MPTIKQVKEMVPVERVLSHFLALRIEGPRFKAFCPFHDDDLNGRPNLVVFPDKGTFHCFVCGAHGDAIDFVSQIEKVSLSEAKNRILALESGVEKTLERSPAPKVDVELSAGASQIDSAYRRMIAYLRLSDLHREILHGHGLSDRAIAANGYRSLPEDDREALGGLLQSDFGDAGLRGVPGLYQTSGGWAVAGKAGLLIPVQDVLGRVIGMQIRADDPGNTGKYRWMSSAGKDGGASPKSPCHVCGWVGEGPLLLTEGPLKAASVAENLGLAACAVAGVSTWRRAVEVVKDLKPTVVILAFDQDADPSTRVAVQRNVQALRQAVEELGVPVSSAHWEGCKGIDDAIVAGARIELGIDAPVSSSVTPAGEAFIEM